MTDVSTRNGMQTTLISPEEENNLRILYLLHSVATSAVRVKFNYEIHPVKLKTILNDNRGTKLASLKQKRVLNQAQWDLLFPMSGEQSIFFIIFLVDIKGRIFFLLFK